MYCLRNLNAVMSFNITAFAAVLNMQPDAHIYTAEIYGLINNQFCIDLFL